MTRHLGFPLALVLAVSAQSALAQITDDFEVDSSASYTVVDDGNGASGDGTPDGNIIFGFDYSALSVPPAPNSAPGTSSGLVMTVNDTDQDAGPADHITAFNNTAMTGSYRLDVDIYMGIDSEEGTTEFAHVGVAGATTDFTSIFTPVVDNGHFMSMTGEGGSGSDYRHSAPSNPAIASGDASYFNTGGSTNAATPFFEGLLPSPEFEFAGSPGNSWIEFSITVADRVTYWINGTPIIGTPTIESDGLISLGYTDPFSSVGGQFIVYDNLSVTAIPEPTSAVLVLAGLVAAARRR